METRNNMYPFAFIPLTVFGLFMLIHPIGMARVVIILIAGLEAWRAREKYPGVSFGIALTMFTAYLADLIAWYVSKESIAPEQATMMWGMWPSAYRAGFPLHQLELPPPPLGPGEGLLFEHMTTIMLNFIFWLAVSVCVVPLAYFIVARVTGAAAMRPNRVWMWLMLGAFFFNVQFMGLYMLWFD